MSNFQTNLEQRVQQILPDFLSRKKMALINVHYLIYSELGEMELSAYQVAFLDLFFENRHEVFKGIQKELDVFFLNNEEWKGATFEGLIIPSDNYSEWTYRVGLMNGVNRRSFLIFQFNEWSIKRYSIQISID